MQIPNGALTALWATPLFGSDGIAISSGASPTDIPAEFGVSFDAEFLLLESGEKTAPPALPMAQVTPAPQAELSPVTDDEPNQQDESPPTLRQPSSQAPAQPRSAAGPEPTQLSLPVSAESPERVSEAFVAEKKSGHPVKKQAEPQQGPPAFWNEAPFHCEASTIAQPPPKAAPPANRPESDPMVAAAQADLSSFADTNGLPIKVANGSEEIEQPGAPQPLEKLRKITTKPIESRSEAVVSDIRLPRKPEVLSATALPTNGLPRAQGMTAQPASDPKVDSEGLMLAEPLQRLEINATEKTAKGRTVRETPTQVDLTPLADATAAVPVEGRGLTAATEHMMQRSAEPQQGPGPNGATSSLPRAALGSRSQNQAQPHSETLNALVGKTPAQKPPPAVASAPESAVPDALSPLPQHRSAEGKAVDAAPVRKVNFADPGPGGAAAGLSSEWRPPPAGPMSAEKTAPVVGTDLPKPALSVQLRETPAPATNATPAFQVSEPKMTPNRAAPPEMIVQADTPVAADIMGLADPGRPVISAQIVPVPVSGQAPLPSHGAELHAARSQILATIHQSASPDGPTRTEIILSPEELGRVHIHITGQDDSLQVRLFVERPETLDLLRRQGDVLAQELRQSGLSHASLSFGDWRQQDQRPDNRNATAKAHGFTAASAEPVASHAPHLIEAGRLHLRL